jgi:cyclophilin family peptidyl-prolyl cis-trans isomerase
MGSAVRAQVVRFETSVGDFDMVLNPTNNPVLQGHVDNMLQYIENNAYGSSWINRADVNNGQDFVLQMGGFYSHTKRPPRTIVSTRSVDSEDPVFGFPAAENGLSNTVGTVALALPSGPGGALQNAGTNSFFINLASNTFLDADFTVFAAVPDLTVVNRIMDLMKVDRTLDPAFGADPGNLAFTDVPLQANGQQVFIKRAFVVSDAITIAQATAGVQSVMALSSASGGGGSGSSRISSANADLGSSFSQFSTAAIPEPASGLILLVGTIGCAVFGQRRFRRR